MATVKLFGNLRSLAGTSIILIEADTTVRDLLDKLIGENKTLAAAILDADGKLRPHYKVMINGHDMIMMDGLETHVNAEDIIAIFPPVAGGSSFG